MLCDRCKMKEARVYFTEIVNGKKLEQHLCEDCAAELTSFQKDMPFDSILSGLFGGLNVGNETACPSCGMTYQEFRRDGKFGCADCYQAFGRYLPGTLKRIQGASAHTGKAPRSWLQEQEEKQRAKAAEAEAAARASAEEAGNTEEGMGAGSGASAMGAGMGAGAGASAMGAGMGAGAGASAAGAGMGAGAGEMPSTKGSVGEWQEKPWQEKPWQEPPEQQLGRMEQQLKQAVAQEEYEEAARLRDAIRLMKQGGGEPVDGAEHVEGGQP